MAQEKGKRAITSGILSYFKPLKESLENELSGSETSCVGNIITIFLRFCYKFNKGK